MCEPDKPSVIKQQKSLAILHDEPESDQKDLLHTHIFQVHFGFHLMKNIIDQIVHHIIFGVEMIIEGFAHDVGASADIRYRYFLVRALLY